MKIENYKEKAIYVLNVAADFVLAWLFTIQSINSGGFFFNTLDRSFQSCSIYLTLFPADEHGFPQFSPWPPG